MSNNWDGSNLKQLEDLNFYSLFNNKTLWEKWFLDSKLDKGIREKCRQLVDEDVFSLNWRTSIGTTVDWKLVGRHWGDSPLVKDDGQYKSIFLDFRQSFLKKGMENEPSNYWVNVFNRYKKEIFAMPHSAIMTHWTAGWPRGGWDPGRYVSEPWELLEPIHDFLDCTISYRQLLKVTKYQKFKAHQKVFDFVYKNIYPWIKLNASQPIDTAVAWRTKLHKLYREAIDINLEEFHQRYMPKNPYVGPSEGGFDFSWFDDLEKMKNPFLRFYQKLRIDNIDDIRTAEASFIKIDKF